MKKENKTKSKLIKHLKPIICVVMITSKVTLYKFMCFLDIFSHNVFDPFVTQSKYLLSLKVCLSLSHVIFVGFLKAHLNFLTRILNFFFIIIKLIM